MEPKWIFGISCVICLTIIQLSAWLLGFDGQVFAFTSSTITGILALLIGLNITPPSQKEKILEEFKATLTVNPPKT